MPDDGTQPGSLSYRKAQAEIWAGRVPSKYHRLLPFIGGGRVLEIGAAEGVLALLLSRESRVDFVTALELREARHLEAQRLQRAWAERGFDVSRCLMLQGDIRERLDLLQTAETLVAVRAIYYLREDARLVVTAARRFVPRVVLCGNRNRAAQYRQHPRSELGRFNFLASIDGMQWLLKKAGYQVATVVNEGDPIVVGVQ
jgi:hypothetical protein